MKLGPGGQVDKHKARYEAKGLKQVEGLDSFEIFAPNFKPETIRIPNHFSAKQDHVRQLLCQVGLLVLINRGRRVSETATEVYEARIR